MTIEEIKAIKRLEFILEDKRQCIGSEQNFRAIEIILKLVDKQQEEIDKYKRYFKLAISDLQSEGYMQMPFKNIENYYSKREDIV